MIIQKNNNDIPEYLDEIFFKKVLTSQTEFGDVEICSLDFSVVSNTGENYMSFIYRVQVVYTQKGTQNTKINYIIKSIPMDGARASIAEMGVFNKEKIMYSEVLPLIESCLDEIKIAPK